MVFRLSLTGNQKDYPEPRIWRSGVEPWYKCVMPLMEA
jgi:hypothetical protein